MKAHKSWLMECVQRFGVRDVLTDAPDNWTADDARKYLDEQTPREYWPKCDSENPDGSCKGHMK